MPIRIAVLESGFVYVGIVEAKERSFVIRGTKNIRVWGTSKGLGELRNGPTAMTVLDEVGTIEIPLHSLNHFIEVDQDKWELNAGSESSPMVTDLGLTSVWAREQALAPGTSLMDSAQVSARA